MTFTPNIPAVGQSLGSSRQQVLDNFAVLRSTLAVNHVDVNSANPGVHTHADLLAQGSNPNPSTGLVSHYSKAVSGVTEWFLQKENSGTVIQMSVGSPTVAASGSTFLPGGLIMQWGICNVSGGGTVNNFTIPFPNNVFKIMVSIYNPPGGLTASNFYIYASPINLTTFNGFAIISGGGNIPNNSVSYLAIGN